MTENICEYSFYNCFGLNGSLILYDSMKTFEKGSFKGCYGLTRDLNIHKSVAFIGESSLEGCFSKHDLLTIPDLNHLQIKQLLNTLL